MGKDLATLKTAGVKNRQKMCPWIPGTFTFPGNEAHTKQVLVVFSRRRWKHFHVYYLIETAKF